LGGATLRSGTLGWPYARYGSLTSRRADVLRLLAVPLGWCSSHGVGNSQMVASTAYYGNRMAE
jgi:hypothetical protein